MPLDDAAIEKRMSELRDTADRYAKAKATESHLDEFRKSKIAILMKDAERDGHKTTAAQEREARAHPDYLALLDGLKEATEQAESLRWRLRIAELGAELWRTQEANKRAERRGYNA